jgi:hypothetical protein
MFSHDHIFHVRIQLIIVADTQHHVVEDAVVGMQSSVEKLHNTTSAMLSGSAVVAQHTTYVQDRQVVEVSFEGMVDDKVSSHHLD